VAWPWCGACAATQDTGWTLADRDRRRPRRTRLLTAATVRYRLALIFTESIILMSPSAGLAISYSLRAAMSIGVAAVLIAREPVAADAVMEAKSEAPSGGRQLSSTPSLAMIAFSAPTAGRWRR